MIYNDEYNWECIREFHPNIYVCDPIVTADEPNDPNYRRDEERYKTIKNIRLYNADDPEGSNTNKSYLINTAKCFSDCSTDNDLQNYAGSNLERTNSKYYCTNPASSTCEKRYFNSVGFMRGDKTCAAKNAFDPRGFPPDDSGRSACEEFCYLTPPSYNHEDLPSNPMAAEETLCSARYMVPYDSSGNSLWTIDNYPVSIKGKYPYAGGPVINGQGGGYGSDYDTYGMNQSFGCSVFNQRWPVGDHEGNCTVWMMNHKTPMSGSGELPDYFCRTDNAYPAIDSTCTPYGGDNPLEPLTLDKDKCKDACRYGPSACSTGLLGSYSDVLNKQPPQQGDMGILYLYKGQSVECDQYYMHVGMCDASSQPPGKQAACCDRPAKDQVRCLTGKPFFEPQDPDWGGHAGIVGCQ
jgi:hypothetical protein